MNATEQQATLDAARAGDPGANWAAYEHFHALRRRFGLRDPEAFDFLRRAVEGGQAEAQFELVKLLRSGWAALGDQGEIRQVDESLTQASLDHARQLLGLAAAQGHQRAQQMLEHLGPPDWEARTVQRSSFGAGVRMLHDPIEEAEADQARPSAARRALVWLAVVLAATALLWGAWALYSSRLAQRTSADLKGPGIDVVQRL